MARRPSKVEDFVLGVNMENFLVGEYRLKDSIGLKDLSCCVMVIGPLRSYKIAAAMASRIENEKTNLMDSMSRVL